jgi:hypothetical protein
MNHFELMNFYFVYGCVREQLKTNVAKISVQSHNVSQIFEERKIKNESLKLHEKKCEAVDQQSQLEMNIKR